MKLRELADPHKKEGAKLEGTTMGAVITGRNLIAINLIAHRLWTVPARRIDVTDSFCLLAILLDSKVQEEHVSPNLTGPTATVPHGRAGETGAIHHPDTSR